MLCKLLDGMREATSVAVVVVPLGAVDPVVVVDSRPVLGLTIGANNRDVGAKMAKVLVVDGVELVDGAMALPAGRR